MKPIEEAARRLAAHMDTSGGKSQGELPEDLFLLISRVIPMVNVDLLFKDSQNRTLLTWRNDEIYGAGWHLPGGVIRFRETAADRVRKVASSELGAKVTFDAAPIWMAEIIDPERELRGHAVALLYRCTLADEPLPALEYRDGQPEAGVWKWHAHCPPDLLPFHRVHARFR